MPRGSWEQWEGTSLNPVNWRPHTDRLFLKLRIRWIKRVSWKIYHRWGCSCWYSFWWRSRWWSWRSFRRWRRWRRRSRHFWRRCRRCWWSWWSWRAAGTRGLKPWRCWTSTTYLWRTLAVFPSSWCRLDSLWSSRRDLVLGCLGLNSWCLRGKIWMSQASCLLFIIVLCSPIRWGFRGSG